MACIELQSPQGRRLVAENTPYVLHTDEQIVGINWACNPALRDNLTDMFTADGFMVGNAIKKVTNALGMKQCLACKGRQRAYNARGLEIQEKIKSLF